MHSRAAAQAFDRRNSCAPEIANSDATRAHGIAIDVNRAAAAQASATAEARSKKVKFVA
jgi:hypothetical protein